MGNSILQRHESRLKVPLSLFPEVGFFKVSEEISKVGDEEDDDVLVTAWDKLQTDCSTSDFACVDDKIATVETVLTEEMVESYM